MAGAQSDVCKIKLSNNIGDAEIHIILEVTDKGTPSLTSYRRIIITTSNDTDNLEAVNAAPEKSFYTIAGAFVAKSSSEIALPAGIYVARTDTSATKLIVR